MASRSGMVRDDLHLARDESVEVGCLSRRPDAATKTAESRKPVLQSEGDLRPQRELSETLPRPLPSAPIRLLG